MSEEILPAPYLDIDEEDEEEEAAARPEPENLQRQLVNFRQEWRQELDNMKNNHINRANNSQVDKEKEATRLFLLGSEAEHSGAFYEAVILYKKAMYLVPDIESKIDFYSVRPQRVRQDSETSLDEQSMNEDNDESLLAQFQELSIGEKTFCLPKLPQRMTHISCLPLELIIYIFRWVVSSDLDLRSLENLSEVCRGFYVCARDEEMWRLACLKVWGRNTRSAKKYGGSWRNMFLMKPHPLFHGCYISRTSYVRQGEQGLDSFYRPFHLIYYYRVLRFFTDGTMLMMCTPEDPSSIVSQMRDQNCRQQGVMKGHFKIHKNKVTALLKRETKRPDTTYHRYRRRQQQNQQSEAESTYFVEFEIENNGRRGHQKLKWSKYYNRMFYKSTGEEVINNFDLNQKTFPPLIFSRVKSYTAITESMLR